MLISEDVANKIYDVLARECEAPDWMRADFVRFCQLPYQTREYRFIGSLGFGGKFWDNNGKFYVSCYPEDENDFRRDVIERTNTLLAEIYQQAVSPAASER